MAIKNFILIENSVVSWISRGIFLLIIITTAIITSAISLQFLYQHQVDNYFSSVPVSLQQEEEEEEEQEQQEKILLIRTGEHTLTTWGKNKDNFKQLLHAEQGEYRKHQFIGWHADYRNILENFELPFSLLYEVTYENSSNTEIFSYTGIFSPTLETREVFSNE